MSTGALADLLALQDVDLAVDQHRHRRRSLPERADLEAVDGRVGATRAELSEVKEAQDAVAARQAAAEGELSATESRSEAVGRRLYGGEVTASRELQAMSDELDHLRSRASGLEDDVLALMEEREPLDARAAVLTGALEGLASERQAAAAALADAEKVLDEELALLGARREEAAAAVPPALLATYERLRSRLGGVAVARVAGSRCDGCHLTLSAAELDHLRHLPEGEVYTCEQCTRILVPG